MNYNNVQYESSYGTPSQLKPSTLPEIVFSGRSNVGKSSLLNKLMNRKSLARVSATPGKTITINFYKADTCYFVDLPGYGYAKRPASERKRWSALMEGYFGMNRKIGLVVQLIDMRHPATEDDIMMLEFLMKKKLSFIVVMTKSDKLNKTEYQKRIEEIGRQLSFLPADILKIPFSAVNSDGVAAIKEQIELVESRITKEA